MNVSKRTISAILIICMLASLLFVAANQPVDQANEKQSVFADRYKESLVLWYCDDLLTEYLNAQAVSYLEQYGIRITPVLVSGVDFFEHMNQASISGNDAPDLYLTQNSNLEKAVLSGLACKVTDNSKVLTTASYPQTALDAITYQSEMVAYPLYYETAFFLYNKSYLSEYAKNQIEAKAAQESADTTVSSEEPAETVSASDADIQEKTEELVPSNIEDILTFADQYDAPEQVESVFKWDVSDIFYNYFMIGNYISVGGTCGDDPSDINIYNTESLACMNVYQDLNQFFSITAKDVTYDSVLSEFLEGKTVLTIATTDAFMKLQKAKEEGTFPYEYGVAPLPDVSSTMPSRGLSVTACVAVNGYSEKQQTANDFASYLVTEGVNSLYARTGKVAARYNVTYDDQEINHAMLEYEKSVPTSKLMSTESLWVKLEIAFTQIWNGGDVDEILSGLAKSFQIES